MTKTTYHRVRTANTMYFLRTDRVRGLDGIERSETIAYGGRFGVLYLSGSELPRVGFPILARDAVASVRTSPVRSVERVSRRVFLAEST